MSTKPVSLGLRPKKRGFLYYLKRDKFIYLLLVPGILYYIIFKYLPMFGIVLAFKDYQPFMGTEGFFTAPWVGLKHFRRFFGSQFSWQLIRNTFLISFYKLLWGFPMPILLALMINEVRQRHFKKTVQTISYLPYFLSAVIVAGLVRNVTSTDGGIVNMIITLFGGQPIFFLGSTQYFRSILVIADLWQGVGWGSIVYLAAMSGIDTQLYEAATVDGASWLRKMWHITLPGILPVVTIMLILRVGNILNSGFEQILLLYSPNVYSVGDVISTYVYREGLVGMKYSFGSAIDLMMGLISMVLVLATNFICKRLGQEGIW